MELERAVLSNDYFIEPKLCIPVSISIPASSSAPWAAAGDVHPVFAVACTGGWVAH
jgi:hypothetical protein